MNALSTTADTEDTEDQTRLHKGFDLCVLCGD